MTQPQRFHQFPIIRNYMTASPYTVGPGQPLSVAQQLLRTHGIRHLPVLDGGRVAGMLSERDLLLVESLPGVNSTVVRVEEAMAQGVFCVSPDAPVAEVVAAMVERKLGSAVVTEDDKVVGVFTTIDALRALTDLLSARS